MTHKSKHNIEKLLSIMEALRDPKTGCPWDIEQNFKTIAPYTIEEAYEVAEAIEQDDMPALKGELGDLLFQVVFHAKMAQEQQAFNFEGVVDSIVDKLIRRHPHVFEGLVMVKGDLSAQWEKHKRDEYINSQKDTALLDSVSTSMPAIMRALKLQKKAAGVGFDWPEISPVMDKLLEEVDELKLEMIQENNVQRISEELGDVMFSCVNLARHLELDPEWVLRSANSRFYKRFSFIEERLKSEGVDWDDASIEIMEKYWLQAKQKTKD